MSESTEASPLSRPAKIIGLAVGVTVAVVAIAAALVQAPDFFLILFLAVLFGVFLTHTSELLAGKLAIGYGWSLAVVTTLLLALAFGGLALFGVQIQSQISKATKHLDDTSERISQFVNRYPTLRSGLASTPFLRELVNDPSSSSEETSGENEQREEEKASGSESEKAPPTADDPEEEDSTAKADSAPGNGSGTSDSESSGAGQAAGKSAGKGTLKSAAQRAFTALSSVFSTTFGLFVNSLLIFFVGLFLAVAPEKYREGMVVLFPPDRRDRTREVLDMMGETMWQWLVGRFGSMLVTGTGAALLLLVLGVPLAITMGFVTALLTFIPNIGGFLALMLALLLALPQGGTVVACVLVGYLVLQLVESYVVTPLIQQHQVDLPPALLIAFQAIMGVVFGFLGAAVASPMLAAGKVAVEEAYVKDVLESSETV